MTDFETNIGDRVAAATAAIHQLDHPDVDEAKKRLERVLETIVALRDTLIAATRAGEPVHDKLRRTNAVLSTIFGTEYPLGGLQWKRVTEAREALAALDMRLGSV